MNRIMTALNIIGSVKRKQCRDCSNTSLDGSSWAPHGFIFYLFIYALFSHSHSLPHSLSGFLLVFAFFAVQAKYSNQSIHYMNRISRAIMKVNRSNEGLFWHFKLHCAAKQQRFTVELSLPQKPRSVNQLLLQTNQTLSNSIYYTYS